VHVPFCAHRCGYCDFVTTSASPELHERYVAALAREWELRGGEVGSAAHTFDTVFVGGGTPTLLGRAAMDSLLGFVRERAAAGAEVTIECNPETVTDALAQQLTNGGVSRVSLGAQSFTGHVLATLERNATPDTVRVAVRTLRGAGIDNLSLDLIWGVPHQTFADLAADLDELIALAPDHISAYELEFKPGTRLAHRWGSVDAAVGEASDEFYDRVVDTLTAAGYEWYETANFARNGRYSRHNLGYWTQADYLGIGIGAVGTVAGQRRTNLPNIARYLAAVEAGELPPAREEPIDQDTRDRERVMLALRLGRPLVLTPHDLATCIDGEWLDRLASGGLAGVVDHGCSSADPAAGGGVTIELTRRGRMLLNSVLANLVV
jgi:oxygen-independent coproporphyrinogen-3 oxidase